MPSLFVSLKGYVYLRGVYLGVDLRNTLNKDVFEKRLDYVFNICKLF